MSHNLSRKLLEKLQQSRLAQVDEGELRNLASQYSKRDFADEQKLRQLIRSLSAISGTTVSAEKEERIIQMFRDQEINPNDLQSLSKWLK